MILIIATLLFFLALLALLYVRAHTLLAYFQQEEYDGGRFLAAVGRMRLYDVIASVAVLVLTILGAIVGRLDLGLVLCAIVFIAVAARERRYKFKKPLVLTGRARRLRAVALPILAVLALSVWLLPILAIVVLQLVPVVLILANGLLKSRETQINARYVAEAKARLAEFQGLKIGVTGSFGKTSVKHILAQVLAIDGNVFYSRGSINTVLGLTRHIRQRLQPAHKYLIAEMGAYNIGSIARLADFVEPEVGIITAVGEAHLERFGSVANVAKGKSELADFVCRHGKFVITTEAVLAHAPFRDLYNRFRQKFVVCGPSEAADVQILETRLDKAGRFIRLRLPDGRTLDLTVPLLASYNATNIALVVAAVSAIAPQVLPMLPAFMPNLEQTPHRLERKERVSAPLLLDDAYNANEQGFREAVEVLGTLAAQRGGRSILVTPGIVELGATHDEVHRQLGELSGRTLDAVYVVNPDRIPSFVAGAKAGGRATVTTVARFTEAQAAIEARYRDPKDVMLYENDLPDVLEETRLL
jgi:UDP-N-acetylmuramoyl-tripeptide--D-alanyl-D-alanine ligase